MILPRSKSWCYPYNNKTRICLVTILLFTIITLSTAFFVHAFAEKENVGVISTKFGDIVISFRGDVAPKTVANFENLTKSGFYDGTIFHRITPGFIIQGGDPNTKKGPPNTWGKGSAGYTIPPEFSKLKHTKYIVSMAHPVTDINGASSQFFIVLGDAPWLDDKYTIFGQVVSGQDVVDKITSIKTDPKTNQPLDPDEARISKVVISSQEKIQSNQPVSNQPVSNQSLSNQPESNQPASNQPESNQSLSNQPESNQPASNQPETNQPVSNTSGNNQSGEVSPQEQNQQKIIDKKALQDILVTIGPIVAVIIIIVVIAIIIPIKLKNRSKRNINRGSLEKEKVSGQIQKESAKMDLDIMKKERESTEIGISKLRSEHQSVLTEIQSAKADLALIKSQYDQSKVEIIKKQIESVKKELDEISSKKSKSTSELEKAQDQVGSAKKELDEIASKINDAKSELSSLRAQEETKKKEIVRVKKELKFIEKELGFVGREDYTSKIVEGENDTNKIVEAASSVVAAVNAKYEDTKKELDMLKIEYMRLKEEYETVKTELKSLRFKGP